MRWGDHRFCEECGRYSSEMYDDRTCVLCFNKIRVQVGDLPIDCDLTSGERRYLAETFGKFDDEQLKKDAPFCRSCLDHPDERDAYPCLRDAKACYWERKAAVARVLHEKLQQSYPTSVPTWSYRVTTNYGPSRNRRGFRRKR